jgi:uncharacterized protein YndB with AHSA1/START domain
MVTSLSKKINMKQNEPVKPESTQLITVETVVDADVEKVWELFTNPKHITNWYFASDDWEAPYAENDLRVGGTFKTTMAAKDGSMGFDFGGTYSLVKPLETIAYTLGDGRKVTTTFTRHAAGTKLVQTFEAEQVNPPDVQKNGWQAILHNFKKYSLSKINLVK